MCKVIVWLCPRSLSLSEMKEITCSSQLQSLALNRYSFFLDHLQAYQLCQCFKTYFPFCFVIVQRMYFPQSFFFFLQSCRSKNIGNLVKFSKDWTEVPGDPNFCLRWCCAFLKLKDFKWAFFNKLDFKEILTYAKMFNHTLTPSMGMSNCTLVFSNKSNCQHGWSLSLHSTH